MILNKYMRKVTRSEREHGIKFSELLLKAALSIPKGRVTTYGRLVKAAGGPAILAQSVTSILGAVYDKGQKDIPFHRIVYSDGRIWTSPERHKERLNLYKKEGIKVTNDNKIKDFKRILFDFN